MGAVYLFHDLYGYLLEMSPDIADLVEAFAEPRDVTEVYGEFAGRFDGAEPAQLVDILSSHAVLIEPDEDEIAALWAFAPIKGKWNVWRRTGDTLTLYTAWGERPIERIQLDADETRMWDAFDGDKRLAELRLQHDPKKMIALVQRLVHSDVQALKLSVMPWSTYAKRPGMAPPYLASTMPYGRWLPGGEVPQPVALDAYHATAIDNANAQFDHQETTLSHLLRVPHPALRGRTYGQAVIDAVIDRLPPRVRVLEIGAGLGFVAEHAIARLRAAGREVDYTICELSPVLAKAQKERLGDQARWLAGDVLAQKLDDASFELVLANEMVGDLKARQLQRPELSRDGQVDPELLRAASPLAAELQLAPVIEHAPDTFYLQTGALELVARIARWLAPGGTAIVTEFGDVNAWPKLSSHLDHPELSTHFGMLLQGARASGLDARVEFVIDFLDFDREQRGLATTRSHFRALCALCTDAGVTLQKVGYTPALLDAVLDGKLDVTQIGEIRWDRLEDRLMGLVPHEFKALIATK